MYLLPHTFQPTPRRAQSMTENLDLIEYRQGMFKKGLEPDDLPLKIWRGNEIPAAVRIAIKTEGLMNLRGVVGSLFIIRSTPPLFSE